MQLKGKTRKEFDLYLINDKSKIGYDFDSYDMFYSLPNALKIGVYQLYFDSIGIQIGIQVHVEPTMQGAIFKKFRPEILANGAFNNVSSSFFKRELAWIQAVIKANDIRDKQLKN